MKFNLSQSINGNTSLIIPENISTVDVTISCSNYSSGTVKISGLNLRKKIELKDFSLELKVLLGGSYLGNTAVSTNINS